MSKLIQEIKDAAEEEGIECVGLDEWTDNSGCIAIIGSEEACLRVITTVLNDYAEEMSDSSYRVGAQAPGTYTESYKSAYTKFMDDRAALFDAVRILTNHKQKEFAASQVAMYWPELTK